MCGFLNLGEINRQKTTRIIRSKPLIYRLVGILKNILRQGLTNCNMRGIVNLQIVRKKKTGDIAFNSSTFVQHVIILPSMPHSAGQVISHMHNCICTIKPKSKPKGGKKMSGQIRMTPDQMRSRAGEVRNQGATIEEVVNRLGNIINELQTEWEGQASRAFAEQFERLRPVFYEVRQLVDDISTQLDGTANAVEQLDQDIASRFR